MIISLGFELPRTSSGLPEDFDRASRSTRGLRCSIAHLVRSSYLALHRATLTLPVMSPPPRWALTPPFHPYLIRGASATQAIGGLLSVVLMSDCSAWVLPSALPLESGLSSRCLASSDHPTFTSAQEQYREGPAAWQGSCLHQTDSLVYRVILFAISRESSKRNWTSCLIVPTSLYARKSW